MLSAAHLVSGAVEAMGIPDQRGIDYTATTFAVVPILMILGALVLYLWGVQRCNRLNPRHLWPVHRTVAFLAGLATTGIGVFSFVGVYEMALFWDHMVQHLLLIMVAAPLFAISSPLALVWRASTGSFHHHVKKALRSRVAGFLGHPIIAFGAYAIVIPVTHLTSLFNLMMEHQSICDLEHLLFLGVGYLFWRQIFGADPNRYRLHPAAQFLYLFLAIPIDTFTGLSLDNASHETFPALRAMHQSWMPGLVEDLHIGGVIMWVGGDTLMLLPMIPIALSWMHLEERKAVRADRAYDEALLIAEAQAALAGAGGGGPDGALAG
jgi:putative copper resistance protein D